MNEQRAIATAMGGGESYRQGLGLNRWNQIKQPPSAPETRSISCCTEYEV